jgi:citrate lyase beta subunit
VQPSIARSYLFVPCLPAKGAAVAVDGRMVDRPVILKAQAVLDKAEGTAFKQEAMR